MSPPLKGVKNPFPSNRLLRVFAFDPILSKRIETYDINEVTIKLPWSENLDIGPVDEYIEVVDYDPASQCFYAPVDLNDRNLLAQDGLKPSEGTPQFHQQMVYAVARTTIQHFEHALGRRALWSPRKTVEDERIIDREYVEHLRIYPHALREANAYYSSAKKALLFGYFPASLTSPGENMPGGFVFTCLSHDIVAHEMTHALMDGLHPFFIEPTNPDVWALHEAFADVVALFQHFSYPKVLRHQIAQTRGDLEKQNLLAKLAYQFGQAIERYGALRDALGEIDKNTGEWVPRKPDPMRIRTTKEPHARGAILVSAIFESFLTIYKWRIRDLLRIASGGTGILPPGQLHPDLVGRLSAEASKTSRHILNMCIRALDYCPPVDVNYGDYLRALITADVDLISDDRLNYRLAVIEAFRRHGIYPLDVRNLSVESLKWQVPSDEDQEKFLQVFQNQRRLTTLTPDWDIDTPHKKIIEDIELSKEIIRKWFTREEFKDAAKAVHLVVDKNTPKSFYRDENEMPNLEVNSVRPIKRIGPDGQILADLVIEITQSRRGYYKKEDQEEADSGAEVPKDPDFVFRGGSTLLVDIKTANVKYYIYKDVDSDKRLEYVREYLKSDGIPSLKNILR